MGLRHVLLTVPGSHGFQYGMLRDFEDEIVRLTGAAVVPIPASSARSHPASGSSTGRRYAPAPPLRPQGVQASPWTPTCSGWC